MNENINLTEILKGCPKDTEFYSSAYGKLYFSNINYTTGLVYFYSKNTSETKCFNLNGKISFYEGGECCVFPSYEQRDWNKFKRFWDESKKVKKFNPKTLLPFEKILVRDDITQKWKADLFSYYDDETWIAFPINTVGNIHSFAIPYNEETKHLLGTTKEPNEYYKYWEE